MTKEILITDRLKVREFRPDDTPFIIRLVNTPGWLNFVGDKFELNVIQAITMHVNYPAPRLLKKLGMTYEREIVIPTAGDEHQLMLFSMRYDHLH